MRRTARVVALVVLFAIAFAAAWIRLPYYAVGPGPANDVAPLIDVQDVPRYASEGKLIMTTVRWQQVTALQSLVAWIDESRFIVGEEAIYPPGADREQEQERAISEMDQSKIDASIVVLNELFDYPEEHRQGRPGPGRRSRLPGRGRAASSATWCWRSTADASTRRRRRGGRSTACRSTSRWPSACVPLARSTTSSCCGSPACPTTRNRWSASAWSTRSRSRSRSRAATWAVPRAA